MPEDGLPLVTGQPAWHPGPPPEFAMPPAAPTSEPGVHVRRVHQVKAGETLWRIARVYGVSLEALQRENQLADATQVPEGMMLVIPDAAPPDAVAAVPGKPDAPQARIDPHPQRRASLAQIPRAGNHALDPAAGGDALSWPVNGVIISGFGDRDRDHHDGLDLAAPSGTPIRAADSGTVIFSGEQRGYGNMVLIGHSSGLVTVYAHNSANLVEVGERVERGQVIARVGRTGNATGTHLHFEVRVGSRPRDPLGFLR
jgi:murein DD-endopeptidase MepM/ murein hydrolase activator NlpD